MHHPQYQNIALYFSNDAAAQPHSDARCHGENDSKMGEWC